MNALLQHLLFAYKYGHKQLYYFNTFDGSGEEMVDDKAELSRNDFATEEEYDEYCESCAI